MKRLELVLRSRDEPEEVRLEGNADSWQFTRGGSTQSFSVARLPDGRWSLVFSDGRQVCGRARRGDAGAVSVATASGSRTVRLDDPLHDRLSHVLAGGGDSGEEEVRALMPGRVVEVRVSPGQRVEPGAILLVLEAMKMQNEIRASIAATVVGCPVSPGDAVDGGALMILLSKEMNQTPK
jgi:3-methylcrotonyl-CoA carboxylase alpha subunit